MPRLPVALALLCMVSTALPAAVQRVSISTAGVEGNAASGFATVSATGRFVAFESAASTLVADDTNGDSDIFLYDRTLGSLACLSRAADGGPAAGDSYSPVVSADGNVVVFYSYADNLVGGDTNGCADVFAWVRGQGIERLSRSTTGGAANGDSTLAAMSPDGRFVTFTSGATNLVSGDRNGCDDIFLYDRQLDTTELVSVATGGAQGDGSCYLSDVSADGRYVAFDSDAQNLAAGDSGTTTDVFLRDRTAGTTSRLSNAAGIAAPGNDFSDAPAISADGRYVAFESAASDLVAGDSNGFWDVFRYDRVAGTVQLVSRAADGSAGDSDAEYPSLSADGRLVSFRTYSTNLAPGLPGTGSAVVKDTVTGAVAWLDQYAAALPPAGMPPAKLPPPDRLGIDMPYLSGDGRFAAFTTAAALVAGDGNGLADVYLTAVGLLAPAPPTGLTAQLEADGRVDLAWADNSSDEEAFAVDRRAGDGAWAEVALLPAGTTACQDVGLPAPSGLTATAPSASTVSLAWVDNSTDETGFVVERAVGDGGEWQQRAVAPANTEAYTDEGLTTDTTYWYRVRAKNALGVSPASNAASATPSAWKGQAVSWRVDYGASWAKTGVVSVPGATRLRLHFGRIQLEPGYDTLASSTGDSWSGDYTDVGTAAAEVGSITLTLTSDFSNNGFFTIDRVEWQGVATSAPAHSGELFAIVTAGAPPVTKGDLLPGETYTYRVRAVNAAGSSAPSNEASVTLPVAAPAAPTGLVATPLFFTRVQLRWADQATNEEGFTIQRKVGGGSWMTLARVAANGESYVDGTCRPGTAYSYQVRAYNPGAVSAWCGPATASTPAAAATFEDVPTSSELWLYVEALAQEGITAGCAQWPRLFCPSATITCGQAAVWFCRAAGLAPVAPATPTFADVLPTNPQYGYVEAVCRAGITVGCAPSRRLFCPGRALTRGEAAVWLCRAAGLPTGRPVTATFTDVPVGHPYFTFVEGLVRAGVTSGCSPTTYCPDASLTRGQAAVFLCRAFGLL